MPDPCVRLPRRRLLAAAAAMPLGAAHAQGPVPLRLVTGDLPPLAIEDHPAQPGVLIELVMAVFERAGMVCKPEFLPWARAQQEAASQARVMLLPQTRTPERDAQFQWLLKLTVQHFSFFNLAAQPRITSLESAKRHKVGVLRGSPHAQRLKGLGFQARRVAMASSPDDLQRMLKLGMVDAIYGSELITLYTAARAGQALQVGPTIESGDVWLAAGSGVLPDEQRRLTEAHAALERERLTERLFQSYGLAMPRAEPREADGR